MAKGYNGNSKRIGKRANGTSRDSILTEKAGNEKASNECLSVQKTKEILKARSHKLISIDVEVFEFSQNVLTEIGVILYNPAHQKNALFPQTCNIHLIIKEAIDKCNRKWVPDAKFHNITGESMVVSMDQARDTMNMIFKKMGPDSCIVGHGVHGDICFLNSVGIPIPDTVPYMDTQKMWYDLKGITNTKSNLGFVLDKLGIANAFLHNGANDAYYTLMACLMMGTQEDLTLSTKIPEDLVQREIKDLRGSIQSRQRVLQGLDPDSKEAHKTAKAIERLQSSLDHVPTEKVAVRCEVSDQAIVTKLGDHSKKRPNPPQVSFFEPTDYNQGRLGEQLQQLL